MGIGGVEMYMERRQGCSRIVRIPDLMNIDRKKVIVVDGNLFYEIHLFRKFNWICCSIIELVQEIRMFVRSFEDLGMKLVFFFSDGTEGDMSRVRARRAKNVRFAMDALSQCTLTKQVGRISPYPSRPTPFECSVISALRELNCEVYCYLEDRLSEILSYVRFHDCLAILSQNSFYVFCDIPCRYLSLRRLKLKKMETKEYDINKFTLRLGLSKELLPIFAAIVGDQKEKSKHSYTVRRIIANIINVKENDPFMLISTFVIKYLSEVRPEEIPHIVTKYFGANGELINELYFWLKSKCTSENQELHTNEQDINTLNKWERLKNISIQLNRSGNLCSKICLILRERSYEEHVILEDFQTLPPNGLVYRPLRQRMYGLLFQDAPDVREKIGVNEWCMQNGECPENYTTVLAEAMKDVPSISLLTIWDVNNVSDNYNEKWQLFARCVSHTLDFRTFQELPSHLVIPTALLLYLHYEVPKNFPRSSYELLMNREIEVFIAVAVTLQATSLEFITSISIEKINERAVKLMALFLSGCHAIQMVADVCKCVIENKHFLSVWHFFDGKLFHYLYEKANGEEQFDWEKYCEPERYGTFLQIRNIVLNAKQNNVL